MVSWGEELISGDDQRPGSFDGDMADIAEDVPLRNNITLETPVGDKPVRYYIVTFAGADPDSGPIDQADLAEALGMPLYGLGVDLIYSLLYVSPVMMTPQLMAIHEVWGTLDPNAKTLIGNLSPKLRFALDTLVEGYNRGDDHDSSGTANDQATQDIEARERLDHPALNDDGTGYSISG